MEMSGKDEFPPLLPRGEGADVGGSVTGLYLTRDAGSLSRGGEASRAETMRVTDAKDGNARAKEFLIGVESDLRSLRRESRNRRLLRAAVQSQRWAADTLVQTRRAYEEQRVNGALKGDARAKALEDWERSTREVKHAWDEVQPFLIAHRGSSSGLGGAPGSTGRPAGRSADYPTVRDPDAAPRTRARDAPLRPLTPRAGSGRAGRSRSARRSCRP